MSNRRTQRAQAQQFIDRLQGHAFPNSHRVYVQGSRDDLRVPLREIRLSPTLIGGTQNAPQYEDNEPVPVYDTSGPYGDPSSDIDVRKGLSPLRQRWIEERNDTAPLTQASSHFTQQRLADEGLDHLRYTHLPPPRRAKEGRCVTQLHYARAGIITPEMEFIALRENVGRERLRTEVLTRQHPGSLTAPVCRKTLRRNLSVGKWPQGARLFPPILTIPKQSR